MEIEYMYTKSVCKIFWMIRFQSWYRHLYWECLLSWSARFDYFKVFIPPDKSAYLKIIYPISQLKHMFWVLKRTVSMSTQNTSLNCWVK